MYNTQCNEIIASMIMASITSRIESESRKRKSASNLPKVKFLKKENGIRYADLILFS